MKSKKLLNLIKTKDIIIPSSVLFNYKNLKINEKELIFISLLMSMEDLTFNPQHLSERLGFETSLVMELISSLNEKAYLDIVVKKENNKMKEYLNIDQFYEKLLLLSIEEEDEKEEQENKIYSTIEKEFARTLSPIEYETIGGWLNAKIDESLIEAALKEAVLNGVNNLKYIDKILYEWTKKGYKKEKDVKKKNKKKEPEEILLFDDYDWLNEDE